MNDIGYSSLSSIYKKRRTRDMAIKLGSLIKFTYYVLGRNGGES